MDIIPQMQPLTDEERQKAAQVRINPGGQEAKERAKFEQHPSYLTEVWGVGNPYVYRPFPKTLFKAHANPRHGGQMMWREPEPHPYAFSRPEEHAHAVLAAAAFNASCLVEVKDEREMQKYLEMGWRKEPSEAMEFVEQKRDANFQAAGERNYADRNMSEKAKAEIAAAEAASDGEQVMEIKEKPRRRGRPAGSKNKPKTDVAPA